MANATLNGPRSERLRITCECGKTYKARTKLAGKRIRCKVCKGVVRIPNPGSSPDLVLAAAPAALPPELADLPEPEAVAPPIPVTTEEPSKKPKAPKKKAKGVAPKKRAKGATKAKKAPPVAPDAEEPVAKRGMPAGLQLLLVCVAPALALGGIKAIALAATEPPPVHEAPAKALYDVNFQPRFAAGEEYTVTWVEDSATRALRRDGTRSGVRLDRFGRSAHSSGLVSAVDLRNAYEASYATRIQEVDTQGRIGAEVRTYDRLRNNVTGRNIPVRGRVIPCRRGINWNLPGGATLPTELSLILKREAQADEALRRTYKQSQRAFAGVKEKVAVDQIFDADIVPITMLFGVMPHELDAKRSHCVGRLKTVEERNGKNWLTVHYTVKLVAHSYKNARALTPLVGEFTVVSEFFEGGGGASHLKIEGTFKGRITSYKIDNAIKRDVSIVRKK